MAYLPLYTLHFTFKSTKIRIIEKQKKSCNHLTVCVWILFFYGKKTLAWKAAHKILLNWLQGTLTELDLLFSGLACYNTNRFSGVKNETEIEKLAHLSQEDGTFLAGQKNVYFVYLRPLSILSHLSHLSHL